MQSAADFKAGDRVRLVEMDDPLRIAPIGAEGTVTSVAPKPVNVVNVAWDDGFGLNPCLDADVIERIDRDVPGRVFEISCRETYGGTFYVVADDPDEAYGKLRDFMGGDYLSREAHRIDVNWSAAEAEGIGFDDIDVF